MNVMAFFLVLAFGFLDSPGEWVVLAWARAAAFDSHAPEAPEWHDDSPFFCHLLADDQLLAEPDLDTRRWIAGRLADREPPGQPQGLGYAAGQLYVPPAGTALPLEVDGA